MDVSAINLARPLQSGDSASQGNDRRLLSNAVAALRQSGIWAGRVLRIHRDMETQKLTVQFVNSQTNEIMDQIPSEDVLRMASELSSNPNSKPGGGATPSAG